MKYYILIIYLAFLNSFMIATTSGVVSFSCKTSEDHTEWLESFDIAISNLEKNYFSFESSDDLQIVSINNY